MSQMTGTATGARAGGNRFSSSGRAALLLTLAVALGVIALQQIDEVPQGLPGSATQETAAAQAPAAPVETVAPPARPPSEVKVLVANGSGVSGVAARIASSIQPAGYVLGTPGNTLQSATTSSVQYAPGYEAEARVLAESVNLSPQAVVPLATPAPVEDLQSSNVVLIIGTELANRTQGSATQSTASQAGAGQQGATTGQGAQPSQAVIPNSGQAGTAGSGTNSGATPSSTAVQSGNATAVNGPLTAN